MFNRKQKGDNAERSACDLLRKQGLIIVQQNFRSRFGEIDIIAKDGETLVFVEVRLRNNRRFGGGAESVARHKQQRIIQTASLYLATHSQCELPCRFDVIEASEQQGKFQLHWLPNAFQL